MFYLVDLWTRAICVTRVETVLESKLRVCSYQALFYYGRSGRSVVYTISCLDQEKQKKKLVVVLLDCSFLLSLKECDCSHEYKGQACQDSVTLGRFLG